MICTNTFLIFRKNRYEELNEQYDDFQKHSYELENELEVQLKHSDEKNKDLQMRNNRLLIENDTFKVHCQHFFENFLKKNELRLKIVYWHLS